MNYQIQQIDLCDRRITEAIDEFLISSHHATIFHTTQWNRIVSQHFGTNFFYFLAYDGQKIIGAIPCHFVANGKFTTIAYSPPRIYEVSYGGPVTVGPNANETAKSLIKAVLKSHPNTFVDIFNSPLNTEWANHCEWEKLISFETAYVDLRPSLEEIWLSSIHSKRRNMIRKAQREGVEVKACGISELDTYYSIVQQMSQRTGLSMQPKSYYQAILEYFGSHGQARLYIAFHQGKALTGGIFLVYGPGCYYWVGATADGAPNLGQGELIQWQVIQWAKESGCQWYDLVGVEIKRLPQIARFKLGFTNETKTFHHINVGTIHGKIMRRIENLLKTKLQEFKKFDGRT